MQNVKKELSDVVDFFHADKNPSLLQVDTIFSDGLIKLY